jgi:energy-coupling factor transport system ATP-binding protein
MILQPSYLVLDEATSLLAARSRSSILEMVFALRSQQNIGIILITQYPSEAQLGERLVVMHQGRIVFDDLPDRVFRHGDALLRMGVAIPVNERLRVAV